MGGLALLFFALTEGALRVLGLGHPVLLVAHPTIEYLPKPNQKLERFFHRIEYNEFSMRGPSLPRVKTDPNELRVLVIGDSVVNCGATLDQADIATSLLEVSLPGRLGRPVRVMNISAGSWGPQNELAFLDEYGLFAADLAVVVVSTHDLDDVPIFSPLPRIDTVPPSLAVVEAVERYVVPWWSSQGSADAMPKPALPNYGALPALEALITRLCEANLRTRVLYHFTRPELTAERVPEVDVVRTLAEGRGATFEALASAFQEATRAGREPYRSKDPIHTSAEGQRLLAQAIARFVIASAGDGSTRTD